MQSPKVTGGVQVALTTFVITFALLVALAFFVTLWNRPYVFYSPAEFGDIDPRHFADAMRTKIPDQVAEHIREALAKPYDEKTQFSLIDSLIGDAIRQHLILMKEKKVTIPFLDYFGVRFETGRANGSWMSGGISGREIAKKLGGSGLVAIDPRGETIRLTELGSKFAEWLVANGRQNDFYASQLGGWGTPIEPAGLPPQVCEDIKKRRQAQAASPDGALNPSVSSDTENQHGS